MKFWSILDFELSYKHQLNENGIYETNSSYGQKKESRNLCQI